MVSNSLYKKDRDRGKASFTNTQKDMQSNKKASLT